MVRTMRSTLTTRCAYPLYGVEGPTVRGGSKISLLRVIDREGDRVRLYANGSAKRAEFNWEIGPVANNRRSKRRGFLVQG